MLETLIGLLWVTVGLLLYVGQVISVVNFPLAQRLGLQEDPEAADPLSSRLDLMTARWDIVLLWLPPLAGLLMLLDHRWWPAAGLIAGGIYVETGGREWAKVAGLNAQGVPAGSAKEQAIMKVTYGSFIITGVAAIAVALAAMA